MSNNSGKFKVNSNPIPFIMQQMENVENTQESNELEAWKNMMNSMIKFIHASTKLMNTFNEKASDGVLPRFCGMECIPCPPQTGEKQKTTICAAAASQQKAEEMNRDIPYGDTPKLGNNPADNTSHGEDSSGDDMDVTPNEIPTINDETQNTNDTSVGTQKTDDSNNETQTTDDTLDDTKKSDDDSKKPDDDGKEPDDDSKKPDDDEKEPDDDSKKPDDDEKEPDDDSKKPDDDEKEPDDDEDSGTKKDCKGKCSCSGKKKSNQLCACPVNSQETTDLRNSMAAKLKKAQSEIDGLKNELEKLQFLEYTKKSNTAALYKEIMKGTPDMPPPRNMDTAPRSAPAQAQLSCVCSNLITKGFPEPRPMSQSQQTRGFPEGRGPPETGTLYATAQSRMSGQTNNITASMQGHTSRSTNASAMQSFNESNFLQKPASWEARLSTNATAGTTHSFDDSIYPSPPDPRRGPYMSSRQSHDDSSYFRSPAATGRNASRPENIHFGSPSINNTAGVGSRGNQSQMRRSQTAYSGNAALNWQDFGPSGPSFDNVMASTATRFSQGNQAQMQGAPQGYPQMRSVECPKYKKHKRKPKCPIPNQTPYDPRYSSQMNGGGNRMMEDQVPFRAIQVMQAAVTVCTPPRMYADNGYDDEEYLGPPCDNFSCGNDSCEN